MASLRRPVPDARNASLRTVQPDKHQVDFIPAGFRFVDQVHPAAAGQGRLDCKTQSPIEIVRRPFQNLPSGGDRGSRRVSRIQTSSDGIGVQQLAAALEFDRSSERRFSGAGPAITVRTGTLLYAARACTSRTIS